MAFPYTLDDEAYRKVATEYFLTKVEMLRNPLKPYFTPAQLEDPIFTKRAENLSYDDYAALTFKMHNDSNDVR